MLKISIKGLSCLLAISAALGCAPVAKAGEAAMKPSSNADFAFKLFAKTARDNTQNIVVSPFSVFQALSMVTNGAGGETRKQMAAVLGVSSDKFDALNSRNQDLMNTLNKNDKVKMQVANAIYCDREFTVKPSFVSLCKKNYFAEASSLDFRDPKTVTVINNWCSEKTHGKIPKIVEKLTASDRMILLNSIYFKGGWETPFEASATVKKPFHPLTGDAKPVLMMSLTRRFTYLAEKDFQAVALPYAGQHQWMYIFLPAKGVDFTAFKTRFTKANWDKWINACGSELVNLEMPKYTVNYSVELKDSLESMGMVSAFTPRADFTGIAAGGNLFIGKVTHKTFMDVNEEGTEAAAVTSVGMVTSCAPVRREPVKFHVDRPFVTALYDSDTQEVLFLGSVVSP
jgi:serine protease inhibitor